MWCPLKYTVKLHKYIKNAFLPPKADPRLPQDIAYIYKILHCNHFIIFSNATSYETTTINLILPCMGKVTTLSEATGLLDCRHDHSRGSFLNFYRRDAKNQGRRSNSSAVRVSIERRTAVPVTLTFPIRKSMGNHGNLELVSKLKWLNVVSVHFPCMENL